MNAQVRLAGRDGLAGQNLRNLSDATIREYARKVQTAVGRGELVVIFLHWGCNCEQTTCNILHHAVRAVQFA